LNLVEFWSGPTRLSFNMRSTRLTFSCGRLSRILTRTDLVKFGRILVGADLAKFERISVGAVSVEYV